MPETTDDPLSAMHRNQNQFLCKICDLAFLNEALLRAHASAVHSLRPVEQVMDVQDEPTLQTTETDQKNSEQFTTSTAGELYLCSACGEVFVSEEEMEEHCRLAHDGSTDRIYECSECHKRYESDIAFDAHDCGLETEPVVVHVENLQDQLSGELTFSGVPDVPQPNLYCNNCATSFVSQYAFNRHNRIVHGSKTQNQKDKTNFHCGRCSEVFSTMQELRSHSVSIHQMKWKSVRHRAPQRCTTCKKKFSSMGNLNKHLKVVHGIAKQKAPEAMVETREAVEEDDATGVTEIMQEGNVVKATIQDGRLVLPTTTVSESNAETTSTPQSQIIEAQDGSTIELICSSDVTLNPNGTFQTIVVNSNKDQSQYVPKLAAFQGIPKLQYKDGVVTVATIPPEEIEMENAVTSVTNDSQEGMIQEAMVVDESGNLSVDAALRADPDPELTGYVLEIDESLYNVIDSGAVHIEVIEPDRPDESLKTCPAPSQHSHYHNNKFKKDGHWYCSTCTTVFEEKDKLLVHYRQLHLPEECEPEIDSCQQCDICLKLFSTKGNRDKHVNAVHKLPDDRLIERANGQRQEIRVTCLHCNKSFKQRANYLKHVRTSHPDMKKVPKRRFPLNRPGVTVDDRTCHICGKVCDDIMKKEMHVYNHSRNEKEYKCELCPKTFNRSDYYKEHFEKKHSIPRFKCSFCDKRFVRKTYQLIHERVHTNERPYVCNVCGKGFKQWGGLNQHQRFHVPKPPATHFCGQCHRGYSYKGDLLRHMVVHTDRKHVCDYCSKPFPTASQLTVHVRTHTGQRPYKCNLCSMCFMTIGGLKRHEQIHERREQGGFMCAICGVSSRRQSSVDEHIRVFHSDRTEEPIEVQSVDLMTQESQTVENSENVEEVVELVLESDETVQMNADGSFQVLSSKVDQTWVDTTDIEKELVEGILASQATEIIVEQTQES